MNMYTEHSLLLCSHLYTFSTLCSYVIRYLGLKTAEKSCTSHVLDLIKVDKMCCSTSAEKEIFLDGFIS